MGNMGDENYRIFETLAKYYWLKGNQEQACIAYRQALFYCQNESEKARIAEALEEIYIQGVKVPKTAIVILSWNLKELTMQCINSIRQTTPEEWREIIVVDNGSTDGSVEWLKAQDDLILQCNSENHGFPRGCNEGIALASADADIFLLNNDTVLPPNALFWLQIGLYENSMVGATGSRSNYVSNYQAVEEQFNTADEVLAYAIRTNMPMEQPYESKVYLVGFALMLKRKVLDQIGLLDEVFSPGNSEDVDICLRIREAGYENYLCYNSVILHFGSQSFQKLGEGFDSIMLHNIDKLNEKYGVNLQDYLYPDKDLVAEIDCDKDTSIHVLHIGCGAGATLGWVKRMFPNAVLYGTEKNQRLVNIASSIQEAKIQCQSVDSAGHFSHEIGFKREQFDYCILGDMLERITDIHAFLGEIYPYIKPDGKVILSISNLKHWSVMQPLLVEDRFIYKKNGVLNANHLRTYTKTEMEKQLKDGGFDVTHIGVKDIEVCPDEYRPLMKYLDSISRSDFIDVFDARTLILTAKKNQMIEAIDGQKVCFITAVNNEKLYQTCLDYIEKLVIPDGIQVETIAVRDADYMTQAYNAAMLDSDAKYKIYLHQDLMITDQHFLEKVLNIFRNHADIGICGVVGASELPDNCVWWEGRKKGVFIDSHEENEVLKEYRYEYDGENALDVDVLDGLILCTQYDVPWREDIFKSWHFYDLSQCMEFKRRHLRVAVIPAEHSLVEHRCGVVSMDSYLDERRKFHDEYM